MLVLQKIEKLLLLAGNNPSREEAEAAMLKVQTLLARHGLELADLERPGAGPPVDERDLTPEGRRATWWRKRIAGVVARNFRCATYLRWTPRGRRLVLVGKPADARVAQRVYQLAASTADRAARRHGAARREAEWEFWDRWYARALRNDFLQGYIEGLDWAFRRNVEEAGTALMLVEPREVTAHLRDLKLKRSRRSRRLEMGCLEARDSGWLEGREFRYHEPVEGGAD